MRGVERAEMPELIANTNLPPKTGSHTVLLTIVLPLAATSLLLSCLTLKTQRTITRALCRREKGSMRKLSLGILFLVYGS